MTDSAGSIREKLQNKLRELFQFESSDLDFGIYRILNHKRDDIERFIEEDLLDAVGQALDEMAGEQKQEVEAALQKEKTKLQTNLGPAAINDHGELAEKHHDLPMAEDYLELQDKLEAIRVAEVTEARIYSDLLKFFSRYYDKGDFTTLRRHSSRGHKYVVPYDGQEVMLHWANKDQYYIKTGERFTDYKFDAEQRKGGQKVRFELAFADTPDDNNKSNGRYFIVPGDGCIDHDADAKLLTVRFAYRQLTEDEQDDYRARYKDLTGDKRKTIDRSVLNEVTELQIFDALSAPEIKAPLLAEHPNSTIGRTVLGHHLNRYTASNTHDYFIHKDLGGFLRGELDFFLKNEVLDVDNYLLGDGGEKAYERELLRARAVRRIAGRIIQFLAQIENFQKRLFEKKKFVTQTDWCITLGRVPEELYPAILDNKGQLEAWLELYATDGLDDAPTSIDEIDLDLLRSQPHLPIDTALFDGDFRKSLWRDAENIQTQFNGTLIHSENLQALGLLQNRYANRVKFVYIDPPYNTGQDTFIYKDSYQHSSWLTMMVDRLNLARQLLMDNGSIAISIDEKELSLCRELLDQVFGQKNRIAILTIKRSSITGHKTINPGVVNIAEYVLLYARDKDFWKGNTVYVERERDERYSNFIFNRDQPCEEWKFGTLLEAFADHKGVTKDSVRDEVGSSFDRELDRFALENAESVIQLATVNKSAIGKTFRQAVNKSESLKTPVLHARDGYPDVYLLEGKKILFLSDKVQEISGKPVTVERASDIWLDTLPNDLHNEGGVSFQYGKKPESLILRLIEMCSDPGDIVVDYFVGSGTTAAVAQKSARHWLAIDSGAFFNSVTRRRLMNVLRGDGRGVSSRLGWSGGGGFRTVRLESYEDALNNIELTKPELEQHEFPSDYMLGYMLDVESRGSKSLLNHEAFTHPFDYKLNIQRGEVTPKPTTVDLQETFHYLIGMRVQKMEFHEHQDREYRVSRGQVPGPSGLESAVVVWRELEPELDYEQERDWAREELLDEPVDRVYVNGPSGITGYARIEYIFREKMDPAYGGAG